MATDLYAFIGMYSKALGTLDHLADKATAFGRNRGIPEADMMNWRLVADMNPLSFQFGTVCNVAGEWAARAAGEDVPERPREASDFAAIRQRIETLRASLARIRPEQVRGRDDTMMTVDLGQLSPTMPLSQWLEGFATTNIIFHVSIAYAILRSRGVPLGKADLFAGGL